ncbi:hypothetical protein GCM10023311_28700 [Flaviramulus aquimarinus]|uniref:GLPGLI family protein n=1 Tax=Flaviramulus aquimarinus TaxID=1170456 RepID=A0ABP9FFD0_9FLAO
MKKNTTTLIFLISIICFSQNSNKKTYYYFQNNEITKADFKSFDDRKIYTRKIENDSSIVKNIYLHKNTGKLDSVQHQQITMFLTKIIGSEFDQGKKTMIHLYRGNDKKIYKDSKHKKYWKWVKNNSNRYQSFLIGSKGLQIESNKEKHIYLDEYNLLEKLFFQNSNFKINHLLIKPNGKIYIYFGLDDILYALDLSLD